MEPLYKALHGETPLHDTRPAEIAAQESGKKLDQLGYRLTEKRRFSGRLFDIVLARILKDRLEKGLKLNGRERHFYATAYLHYGILSQVGVVHAAADGLEAFSKDAAIAGNAKKRSFHEMAQASSLILPVDAHASCTCLHKKELVDEYFDNWDDLPSAEKGWTNRPDWLTKKDIDFRVTTVERWQLSDGRVRRASGRLTPVHANGNGSHNGTSNGNGVH